MTDAVRPLDDFAVPLTSGLKPCSDPERYAFSPEEEQRIIARLREFDHARAVGEVSGRTYLIGGPHA
jgi:hypothetical protein